MGVVERMAASLHSCTFVVDRGEPVGVVTERDLVRLLVEDGLPQSLALPVGEVMSGNLILARESMCLKSAIDLSKQLASKGVQYLAWQTDA